jgi:hypothetical protein
MDFSFDFERPKIIIKLEKPYIFKSVIDDIDGLCWFYSALNSLFINDIIKNIIWKKVFVLNNENKPIGAILNKSRYINKKLFNKKITNKQVDIFWYTIISIISYILQNHIENDKEVMYHYEYLLNNIIYKYSFDIGYKFVYKRNGIYSGNNNLFITSFIDYFQLNHIIKSKILKNKFSTKEVDLEKKKRSIDFLKKHKSSNLQLNFYIKDEEYSHSTSFLIINNKLYFYDINCINYILKLNIKKSIYDNLIDINKYLKLIYDFKFEYIFNILILDCLIEHDNIDIINKFIDIDTIYQTEIDDICDKYNNLYLKDFIY